jgi:ABC-type lipoprotein export system ATPase subunit
MRAYQIQSILLFAISNVVAHARKEKHMLPPPTEQGLAPHSEASPIIRVERLTRVIATRTQRTIILEDITFSVPAQSLFAINGPSGSGKSTLLNLLTGIDRPTSGKVVFAGKELRGRSENALAKWRGRNVGIVFQFFQLIPTLTTLENVLLALELGGGGGLKRNQWRSRALECLEAVGLAQYTHRLPNELSGGQQQRVAIARALGNDPPVLVADEPTGNLDSVTAHQVFDALAGLIERGKTVIYVTHDRELAARASARIELLDGRVAGEDGASAIVRAGRMGGAI